MVKSQGLIVASKTERNPSAHRRDVVTRLLELSLCFFFGDSGSANEGSCEDQKPHHGQ